jgi:cell division transport system permease protein
MILTLFVFEGLVLFNIVGKQALISIQEKVDISVYFKSNVPEDSILNVKRSLESLDEVKAVEYVSREKALSDFKERHKDEETIVQTLDELSDNPLLASLNVKAQELNQYDTIASYLETPSLKDIVEKVTYAQNKVVIDRLSSWIRTLNQTIVVLTIFLAFVAITVTFNTIRLTIFSMSEQISIMRLVGASNGFIRGPFVVEGFIYGLAAAVISFAIFIPVIGFISPHLSSFITEIDLNSYFREHWLGILGYQLLFGLVLSVISSIIAIRRYLRV